MIHGGQKSRGGGLIRTSEAACRQNDGTPGCPRQSVTARGGVGVERGGEGMRNQRAPWHLCSRLGRAGS